MADQKVVHETGAEHMTFLPSSQVPIRFADGFLVAGGGDVFTLNFYQTEIPSIEGSVRDKQFERQEASCFARVALSPIGFIRLLNTMADRLGLVVTPAAQPAEQEKQ